MVHDQQQVSKVFVQNLKFEVGNGNKIKFWEDPWIPEGTLMSLFPALYAVSQQQFTLIANMGWFEGTIWKWSLFWRKELTPEESQQHKDLLAILSTHYPLQNQIDSILWKGHKNYTVKDLQQSVSKDIMIDSVVCTV